MTPVWKLRPIDPASRHWRASCHNGEVIIRAATEDRAREIANDQFAKAHKRRIGESIIFSPWNNTAEVACERVTGGEFVDGVGEAILSPAHYDAEFQQRSAQTVDLTRPIEVADVFGQMTPAEYVQQQVNFPDRYEIMWQGKKWTVAADHHIQGPTDAEGFVDPGFRVRNRRN